MLWKNQLLLIFACCVCWNECQGKLTAKFFIDKFSMQPHIEGGWFVETYRSTERYGNLPERYGVNATRTFGTHIYHLITSENFSSFHRVNSDEQWHFYLGAPITVFVIDPSTGILTRHHLGRQSKEFFLLIKHGHYFASKLRKPGKNKFSLIGVSVSPGFEYDDFYMPKTEDLLKLFPQHEKLIKSMSKP